MYSKIIRGLCEMMGFNDYVFMYASESLMTILKNSPQFSHTPGCKLPVLTFDRLVVYLADKIDQKGCNVEFEIPDTDRRIGFNLDELANLKNIKDSVTVRVQYTEKTKFLDNLHKLTVEIPALKEGWDSYKAKPVPQSVITNAIMFLKEFKIQPVVYAMSEEIHMDWIFNDDLIEAVFSESGVDIVKRIHGEYSDIGNIKEVNEINYILEEMSVAQIRRKFR